MESKLLATLDAVTPALQFKTVVAAATLSILLKRGEAGWVPNPCCSVPDGKKSIVQESYGFQFFSGGQVSRGILRSRGNSKGRRRVTGCLLRRRSHPTLEPGNILCNGISRALVESAISPACTD